MSSGLVVEDEPAVRSLFSRWLEDLGLTVLEASHGKEALEVLTREQVSVIVADLHMPVMDGFTLLRLLHSFPNVPPVVVITGAGDVGSAVRAMKMGARDYLSKPIQREDFQAAVHSALTDREPRRDTAHVDDPSDISILDPQVEQLVAQLSSAERSDALLDALVTALDAREREAGAHSRRVSHMAVLLGKTCGLSGDDLTTLAQGALLHDLGKIGVSDAILLKPGPLNESEWAEMRLHPEIGARILSKISHLRPVTTLVLHHHERFDGTGYPSGLRGDAIPLEARLFSVVDALDAMLADRPYRLAKPKNQALEELRNCAGGQFDPEIVDAFFAIPQQQWAFWYENVSD